MAEFSFNVVTMTLTETDGVVTNLINVEGTAEGFGAVVGTVTVASRAGETSGTYRLVLENFPETGDGVTALGDGEWSKVAWDRFSTAGPTTLSNGETIKGDGVFDFSARTWSGTFA
jgi:hypothetical protein